jgi:hypothetical protein
MSSSSTDTSFDGEGDNERNTSQLQPESAEMEAETEAVRQHNMREEGNVEEEGKIPYYDYTSDPLILFFFTLIRHETPTCPRRWRCA